MTEQERLGERLDLAEELYARAAYNLGWHISQCKTCAGTGAPCEKRDELLTNVTATEDFLALARGDGE